MGEHLSPDTESDSGFSSLQNFEKSVFFVYTTQRVVVYYSDPNRLRQELVLRARCYYNKYPKPWKWLGNWVMCRGQKNAEVPARKNRHHPEQAVKGDVGEILVRKRRPIEKAS